LSNIKTIADGLAAPFAGKHTFAHVRDLVDEVILVSDEAIRAALRDIWGRCKVLAEPAACAPVAGLLSGQIKIAPNSNVCCVICGGNIDMDNVAALL
jgi:threonine dehydratase